MRKYQVNFITKSGRQSHRRFVAPSLSEAQAQFKIKPFCENITWHEVPYLSRINEDTMYDEYVQQHPDREISFIAYGISREER